MCMCVCMYVLLKIKLRTTYILDKHSASELYPQTARNISLLNSDQAINADLTFSDEAYICFKHPAQR